MGGAGEGGGRRIRVKRVRAMCVEGGAVRGLIEEHRWEGLWEGGQRIRKDRACV